MESAGQDQALHHVNWVPDPDHTYRAICAEIFGVDDRDRVLTGGDGGDGDRSGGGRRSGRRSSRRSRRGPGAARVRRARPRRPATRGDWSTGIRVRPAEPGEDAQSPAADPLYQSPDLRARSSRDADTGPIPIQRPPTDYEPR